MKFHLVLPAAGVGKRFGSAQPKQYCQIKGQTVLQWTLQAFENIPNIDQQVLALALDDQFGRNLVSNLTNTTVVSGGEERSDSVINALQVLLQKADRNDWVLVHDIARPCVRATDVEKLMLHCQLTGRGGVLARPMTDTIKQTAADGSHKTIDRSSLWAIQTPQCFQLGLLFDALTHCQQLGVAVTDESSAIEAMGMPVDLVEGSADNIKLTHAEDQHLVECFLTIQGRA